MPSKKKAAPSRARPSASASTTPAKAPPPRPRRNFASIQLHFAALISYAISFEHFYSHPNKINQGFGGHYQFLTNIVLVLSTVVAFLGALEDMNAPRMIQSLKGRILFLATPLSLLITLAYWPTYILSPSSLTNAHIPTLPPLKKDIGFHFLPSLFLVIDLFNFTPRRPTLSLFRTFGVFGVFLSAYASWLWFCWSENGVPAYPILETMGVGTRVLLGVGTVGVLGVISVGLEGVCRVLDEA